ncbi:MAG: DNA polymerase III subunit alpha [Myxococcales bacterium]|nr:DNA polymerase III subunit alpha [Myxococcales bacterium]
MPYAELLSRSCFSLLDGASQPHELVEAAARSGVGHLGVADRDSVYGLVQAHKAASDHGVHLLCGASLTIREQPSAVMLVSEIAGWSSLCRILTLGRREEPKGRARVPLSVLAEQHEGLICLLRPGWREPEARVLREAFGDRLAVALSRDLTPADGPRVRWALDLAARLDVGLAATNDVRFHDPTRKLLSDVLTCIRKRTQLASVGRGVMANEERGLLTEAEFSRRYAQWPRAIEHARRLAERCTFSLSELRYGYPTEVVPSGHSPMSWLRELTRAGLADRYPDGVPDKVQANVVTELGIIEELDFPSYFLTVHDVVAFARSRGILCQGRGSAANSSVCYALGITEVDPGRTQLLFERFISKERGEPPDIDVDFEHERREEVIQYIYERYGRDRAAMVNEFICYRQRSAIRDVGKVFGLSLDQVDRLAKSLDRWSAGIEMPDPSEVASGRPAEKWSEPHEGGRVSAFVPPAEDVAELVREAGLDPESEGIRATLQVASELAGFPRHLSIHVGGFVIAAGSLHDLVPVEPATMDDRTVLQWDKYDIDVLDFVKVDVLGLGMLTAIRKAFDLIEGMGGPSLTLSSVPAEDAAVYDMFCKADTVGVFQIESRAQMSMLPRLKPKCFYDLVIEVAIVRPGPIQGGMVHPYLRRRGGEEPVTYAHPALVPILERTLGVPLFQEQVMAMAVAVGGFTGGEADQLRRAMGAWRKRGNLHEMGTRLVEGMVKSGITRDYANAVFAQILGFGEYGFPESHAASFALLVYISGWLKCHYPAAFAAALINSQPMGFYSPRALLADAQRHGVEVRGPCVMRSTFDCTLERTDDGGHAIRVGLRLVRSLGEEHVEALVLAREARAFSSLADLARRSGLDRARLEALAEAGALAQVAGEDRRRAAWVLQGLWTDLPLFAEVERKEPTPDLPVQDALERLKADYRAVGLSVERHPLELLRRQLTPMGVSPLQLLTTLPPGQEVRIAGLVSSRQRPGTASGVVFMTFEDETAMANLVVWPKIWAAFRRLARTSSLLGADGTLQRHDDAVSVLVERFWALPDPDSSGIPDSERAPQSAWSHSEDSPEPPRGLSDLTIRSRDFR